MITVLIYRTNDNVIELEVSGHAESAEYGEDIVCASISVLAQTCLLALNEVAVIENIMFKIEDGYLWFKLPKQMTDFQIDRANVIIESILVGIKGTREMYPDYIQIIEREVLPDAIKNESSTLRK